MSLKINEIYYSIQGESSHSGRPCIFIRLTYCNLRCTYCDTEYAFYEGSNMTIDEILKYIKKWNCNLVEVTGGEPLFQKECINLLNALINKSYEVLLETGGSLPIGNVPKNVIKIIDFKCPSSGMEKKNLWSIVKDLQVHDEIKFVIGNKEDFEWSKNIINKYSLNDICTLFFSPVYGKLKPAQLVDWILNDNINVRMQLQMHKSIWPADKKGV
tara:strand:+ start:627 stop:1268 length:642 start_codon:yes stop_codon:yes gene_type:complete